MEFGGREFAPLYTPKNDTLINLFRISDDEQRQLRTVISSDMARERDRMRKEAQRRAAGAVARETYLEAAEAKRVQAQALRSEGLSVRAIAQRMGISKTAVGRYLTEGGECPKSVRITGDQAMSAASVPGPSVLLMAKPSGRGSS